MTARELYALPIRQNAEPNDADENAARELAPQLLAYLSPAPANLADLLAVLPPNVIARAKTLAVQAKATLPRPIPPRPTESLPGLAMQERLSL
jgi:hypothetical protein